MKNEDAWSSLEGKMIFNANSSTTTTTETPTSSTNTTTSTASTTTQTAIPLNSTDKSNIVDMYKSLGSKNKWKLECSGRYVEDVMQELAIKANYKQ